MAYPAKRDSAQVSATSNIDLNADGGGILVQITGNTFVGTVDFKATVDGATFYNIPYFNRATINPSPSVAQISNPSTATLYLIPGPLGQFRIAVAVTSGTVDVVYRTVGPEDYALLVKEATANGLIVQGAAADGATAAGNPVRMGAVDGSGNAQGVISDTTGNLIAVGDTAEGTASPSTSPHQIAGEDDDSKVRRFRTDNDGVAYVKDIVPAPQSEVVMVAVTGTFTTAIQLTALDYICSQVSVVFRNRNTDAEGLVGDSGAQTMELKKGESLSLGQADPRTVYLKAHTTAADDADGMLTLVDRPAFRQMLRRLVQENEGWYLPCNERSGTAIADLGKLQANFTLTGATLKNPGVFGLGIDYDATGDFLKQASVQSKNATLTMVETNGSAAVDDSGAVFSSAIRDGKHEIWIYDTAAAHLLHGYIGTTDPDGDNTRIYIYNSPARTTQSWVEGGSTAFDNAAPVDYKVFKEGGFNPANGFTVGGWVQIDTLAASVVVGRGSAATTEIPAAYRRSLSLEVTAAGLARAGVYLANSLTSASSAEVLKTGRWYFLVMTYSPSTYLRIFVNGRLDTANTTSIPATVDDSAVGFCVGALGGDFFTASTLFDGRISHPFYIAAALDANTIRTLHAVSTR